MTDLSDDDALAAEYVIGTLDPDERALAERRLQAEPAFGRLVDAWARRLVPLLDAVPDAEPDAHVREAILTEIARLPVAATVERGQGTVVQLRREIRRWRVATGFAAALAALLALWVARAELRSGNEVAEYLAVLQQGSGSPAFLVSLDLKSRRMTIVPSGASAEPGKSLELWMIGSGRDPQSLGLVDPTSPIRASLPDESREVISHAVYAVTLEQQGGSPTGKPSSSPVYVGRLLPERP